MTHRIARQGLSFVALLVLATLSACASSTASATAPTPTAPLPTVTPTVPGTPAGWSAARGHHFTIAYPSGWTYNAGEGGAGLYTVNLIGPQTRDQISVAEMTNIPQGQRAGDCAIPGAKQARLAGAMMSYSVVGKNRVWNFLTSADTSYYITAFDADQPATMQAQHDTILATLRLDDTASGCS